MLGLFQIHQGPPNEVCLKGGYPKNTHPEVAFSRDGFHWHRPSRRFFIAGTKREGDWDRAYIHAATGGCLVVGDKLHFYYGAWSGASARHGGHMFAGGATGLATLRRDGFVSMNAGAGGGTLTTGPVTFGGRYLFVNVDFELVDREVPEGVRCQGGREWDPELGNRSPVEANTGLGEPLLTPAMTDDPKAIHH